jgi:hypothetical protein
MVAMSYDESGVTIYQAGEVVPAGYYARVDDGSYHIVLLEQAGALPPSFDGHVASYRAACSPTLHPAEIAGERARGVDAAPISAL